MALWLSGYAFSSVIGQEGEVWLTMKKKGTDRKSNYSVKLAQFK